MRLLIVESPARASLLSGVAAKISDVSVISCNGIYAGLPKKQRAFDPKENFVPKYGVRDSKTMARIKAAISEADEVVALTLDDDEGEFIAKQISITSEVCGKPFNRVRVSELTSGAVAAALEVRSSINESQVNAYLAREAIERFIAFEIGPLVEKRLGPGAGVLRLSTAFLLNHLARRERKVRGRPSEKQWAIYATLEDGSISESVVSFPSEQEAITAAEKVKLAAPAYTSAREAVPAPAPFNTSSLLHFLAARYDFSPAKSLDLCDALYAMGMITYPYTQATTLRCSTVDQVRDYVLKTFGSSLLSPSTRFGVDGGEEAVRPVAIKVSPADSSLGGDLRTVYSAIWFRTLATQGNSYVVDTQECVHEADGIVLRARGAASSSLGWHQLSSKLFLDRGQTLEDGQLTIIDYAVRPRSSGPVRHTYASLLHKLDEAMMGRPSLYRSMFTHLLDEGYVIIHGGTVRPTLRGESLVTFLKKTVPDLLDADFCAEAEEEIDSVRSGAPLDAFMRYYWEWAQNACALISTKSLRPKFRCPEDDSALRVWLPANADPVLQSASTAWSSPFCFDAKGHIVLVQRTQ
jgi:DNA topoisomerase I